MKKTKENKLHIAIIVLGIIFVMIPIWHDNLWYDEAFTVGIVKNNFCDIWRIGSYDVHPVLYYWILHLVYIIFGSNIYVYRIVSVIPLAILGILGYTHIRKDFGEKVGILFSFFTFFLPVTTVYAGEIRMYTWAMLFVTIMAIYAYRIYKEPTIKNWLIFAIFSLASAYTHYYALATAGIINLMLFIYLICKTIKLHKENKENKIYSKELKCFTISAIAQILLYTPWAVAFLSQIKGVSNGYWIPKPSLKIFLQIFTFQFTGDLDATYVQDVIAMIFGYTLIAYTMYLAIINKERRTGILAIGIYLAVIFVMYIISLRMPILYARYFLTLTGLLIFFLAFFIAKGKRKIITIVLCCIMLIMTIVININSIKKNYAKNNKQVIDYIEKDFQKGDVIYWGKLGEGFSIVMQLKNNDIPVYYYDKKYYYWTNPRALEAYGNNMIVTKNIEIFNNYKGRMWIIGIDGFSAYDELIEKYGSKIKKIKQEKFNMDYHSRKCTITLIEKDL